MRIQTHISHWRNWSIRTRLMVIAIFPVVYLFFAVIFYSYYARSIEEHEVLVGRAISIATALAEGVEIKLLASDLEGIKQMIEAVIQTDRSIYRIEIFDQQRELISQVQSTAGLVPEDHFFEVPMKRPIMWVASVDVSAASHVNALAQKTVQTRVVGFARIIMTPQYIRATQKHRFLVELMMSVLALGVSIGLAWFLSGSLTRPIKRAKQALHDISQGATETQLSITTGGEIGALQNSINLMAKSMHQAQQNLEHKVQERTKELMQSRNEAIKADAEKRRLIHKVNSIVEAERQSIAVEIHDELNASLIAVRLESERIAKVAQLLIDGQSTPVSDETMMVSLHEVKTRAKAVIKLALILYTNGRNLVRRLRPEVLELLGLQGAVEDMLRYYNESQSACHFYFDAQGEFAQLNPDTAISVYRILQEASSNILKHANAKNANNKLLLASTASQQTLSITVHDDGLGFDPEQAITGIGISGMRERVLVLNGEFMLTSAVGMGTRIEIVLPLE
ncbi:MAG: HAMP domain-containing protein [Undibacterium sp.]|nr:HAMP domain-containing protein [Undibacterium sp.]